MKVDGSLKSLLQGVSQQPPRDRLSGQATAQINMSADPVSGLTRRPPTDLVGSLGSTSNQQSWFDFETQNGNKYLAAFRDNTIKVYDTNAVEQTVTIESDAAAYLTGNNFVCGASENEVVVSNTDKVTALTSATSVYTNKGTGSKPQGIIQVLGGGYARKYTISMDGVEIVAYRTVIGADAWDVAEIRTTHITEVLAYLLVNLPGAGGGPVGYDPARATSTAAMAGADWTVSRFEDIIHIKRNTGAAFVLSVNDDAGNLNMKSMTETVPDTSDLPRFAPQGYLARIATETDPEEDLFLQFIVEDQAGAVATGAGFGRPGYWQECVASGIKYQFDAATMPHILEYDDVADAFTFRRGEWKDRLVGTTISNPDPSFVGKPINDVGSFQNRRVFLSGKNVIMSRTNKPTDFWMGSVSAVVDSDPIDISSSSVRTSQMVYAVPHNKDLIVFAQRGQFVIFGRTGLTPANAAMVLTTAFEAALDARPEASGRNVFFAITYGRFAGMREFYTEGGTDINDTRPITQHIKKYIEGTIKKISVASNYDLMFANTDVSSTSMYAYQYIWSDTEKVQSAWSTWVFSNSIVFSFFDRDVFYLVQKDGTSYNLLRMPLDVENSAGMEFPVYLDARFDVFGCNTQFTLPAVWMADEELRIVQSVGCPNPGMEVDIASIELSGSDYVVTLAEDMLGGDVIGGIQYRSSYMPTMPLIKDEGGVVIGTGSLRVRGFLINIEDTGDITGIVTSKYSDGVPVPFQGRVIGDIGAVVGEPGLYTGAFFLPYRTKTTLGEIEVYTNSFYPMTLLDIEWVGQYNKRGRRIQSGG